MIPPTALPDPMPDDIETAGRVRVPLSELSDGIRSGDVVEFTVESIDATGKLAILTPIKDVMPTPENAPDVRDGMTPKEGTADGSLSNDTSVLLGPMKGLKNYLVEKSQNVAKNMGR